MMTPRGRASSAIAVAASLAVLALTAACTDAPMPVPTTATPVASSPPASTPASASTTLTAAERDLQGAEESITSYWTQIAKLAADPKSKVEDLTRVARAQAAAQWRQNLAGYRAKQWRQVGTPSVESVDAVAIGDDRFKVTACVDFTKVNVVDKDGKSVVAATRVPRNQYTYVVEKDDGKFYVVEDTLKGTPC